MTPIAIATWWTLCLTIGSNSVLVPRVDFAHEVVPILRRHCVECHGGDSQEGDFSIRSRESILEAGVIRPGNAEGSRLYRLISTSNLKRRMPPTGRQSLSPSELETLRKWIDEGLAWEPGFSFAHKAYEPPLKPRVPTLPDALEGREHPIDRLLDHDLRNRAVEFPGSIRDGAFLRRLSLDVIGLLPTPEELDAFEADSHPQKRPRLIHEIMSRDREYAEHWMTFWNDLLRNDYAGTGYIDGGRKQISQWLFRSLEQNMPYDEFVRALIAPDGPSEGFIRGIKWRGRVNASQTPSIQFAQNVSQVFLGINMKCASCHDSFVDHWKLQDAYGLAAIVSESPIEIHRCDVPTGEYAAPKWIFPELGSITSENPPRERLEELASLMTHEENGRFTRTLVNRIWHRLMGRGIVTPVDAMHTEPWNEDLLDHLASHFASEDYDVKKLIEWIVSSEAYQSVSANTRDPQSGSYRYEGPLPRRMTAEQFVDAVWALTGASPNQASFRPQDPRLQSLPLPGQWIWSYPEASSSAPAGERIVFRRTLSLPPDIERADIIITCDNEYELSVDGEMVRADKDWPSVEVLSLVPFLDSEECEIRIEARNAGASANPAGLFAVLRIERGDGTREFVGTDESWEWTQAQPEGLPIPSSRAWTKAAPVHEQSFLGGAVQERLREALHPHESNRFVRASMMKSDLLMRSLGRPNREQVVTTRPESLTTLQAIDLANGEMLADLVTRGAKHLEQHAPADPIQRIDWLYRYALSRPPGDQELELFTNALHNGALWEDLLWALIMLPEFQWIR